MNILRRLLHTTTCLGRKSSKKELVIYQERKESPANHSVPEHDVICNNSEISSPNNPLAAAAANSIDQYDINSLPTHKKPIPTARRAPMILTYALSPTRIIDYIDRPLIEAAVARAFDRYSRVIPVFFLKAADFLDADVKVGFSSEDEDERYKTLAEAGTRSSTLAYASWRKDGRVCLNTSVRWSVDFNKEKSRKAMDLETVLVHEIGHLLGLKHSLSKDSVMYRSQSHRKTDVELKEEDVKNVQAKFVNSNYIHKRDWKILTVAGHFNPANQCAGGGFILWDGARKLIQAQSFPLGCGSTASARFEACCHGLNFLKLRNLEKVMVLMDCAITGQGTYTRDASELREWLLRALRFTGDGLRVGEWLIHQATDIKLQNRYREGLVATAELAKKGSRFELECHKEEELPESVVELLHCEGRMLLHLHIEDFPI